MADHREIPIRSNTADMAAPNKIINSNNHNPYINVTPMTSSTASKSSNPMDSFHDVLNRCGKTVEKATKQAEGMADNFWKHIRMVSNSAEAAMASLVQGTRALTYGGYERVFVNTFGMLPGEKLLKQYACYISTPNGPIIGNLYISTKRLAFCSDHPFYYYPVSPHNSQSVYYKVVVSLEQLSRVNPCVNRWNPSEKYIEIITVDGYELTFMGFLAYDKALKTLSEASHQYRSHSTAT